MRDIAKHIIADKMKEKMVLRLFGQAVMAIFSFVSGCASPPTSGDGGTDAEQDTADPILWAVVEPIGQPLLGLLVRETKEFQVSYQLLDGSPIKNAVITFTFKGAASAHDSTLSALRATTDSHGIALGSMTAGNTATSFWIEARAPGARPAAINVSIGDQGFGSLTVETSYGGEREIMARIVRLFTSMECEQALQSDVADREVALVNETAEVSFSSLPAGVSYAVVAEGRRQRDGETLALACRDHVLIGAEREVRAQLTLADLPLSMSGQYQGLLRINTSSSAEYMGERLRDDGLAAIAAAGGDSALMLDGLAQILSDAEASDALDELSRLRSSGHAAVLDAALTDADKGASRSIEILIGLLNDHTSELDFLGIIRPGAEDYVFVVEGLVARGSAARNLQLDFEWLTPPITTELNVRSVDDALDAMQFSFLAQMGLGSVTHAAALALFPGGEEDEGLVQLLVEHTGCDELAFWVNENETLHAACDSDCVAAACISQLRDTLLRSFDATDAERNRLRLSGQVILESQVGRRTASSFAGELNGSYGTEEGPTEDDLSAELSATLSPEE